MRKGGWGGGDEIIRKIGRRRRWREGEKEEEKRRMRKRRMKKRRMRERRARDTQVIDDEGGRGGAGGRDGGMEVEE